MKAWTAALALALAAWSGPALAAGPDPGLDGAICDRPASPARDQAEVEAATRALDARHKAELAALREDDAAGFEASEQAYLKARRDLLLPLAAHGNARAVFRLSYLHLYTRADFADAGEGQRLQACAAVMGDPRAALEMFKLYWHDRTELSVEAIHQRRAIALGWIDRALAAGDPEGFAYLAAYLSAGFHLYALSPELGGRLAVLCVETGGYGCRRWLPPGAAPARRRLDEVLPEWRAVEAEIQARDCPTLHCSREVACRCD